MGNKEFVCLICGAETYAKHVGDLLKQGWGRFVLKENGNEYAFNYCSAKCRSRILKVDAIKRIKNTISMKRGKVVLNPVPHDLNSIPQGDTNADNRNDP